MKTFCETRQSRLPSLLIVLGLALSSAAASAQAAPDTQNAPRRPPPPESLAACKSLQAGAACTFSGPRGAITGVCRAPEGRALACVPKDMSPPPSGNPPPAAK